MRKTILFALATAIPVLFATSAMAELRLYGGGHFQTAGAPLAEAFMRKTGIATSYTPGNTGNGGINRRLAMGEIMDVIVMNRDEINDQVKMGVIKADSIVSFGQDRMGLAVKKGAPKPDISTPEKLRAVLLAARSVGMQEPDPQGHSGMNVKAILTKLGILDQVSRKAVYIENVSADLLSGKTDISFWSYPELLRQDAVDVVGPAPGELGGFTEQAIGVIAATKNDADARTFIRFLASADGAAVYRKYGLDPLK